MSIITDLLESTTNPLKPVFEIINKLIPDRDLATKINAEIAQKQQDGDLQLNLAQIEVNKIEAQSSFLFVSGWRPYIGWGCGTALIYSLFLRVLIYDIAHLFNSSITMPAIDIASLTAILLAMLGMSQQRTNEKIAGVAREVLTLTKGKPQ